MAALPPCAGLAILVLCASLAGCAASDVDHLALTNLADRTVVPADPVGRWAATPFLVAVGTATIPLDNLVVAPVVHVPSATRDAGDWLKADVGGYWTEMGVLPIRVALAPVVWLGAWVGRTILAIEPEHDAWWGWPTWGRRWSRDEAGHIVEPAPPDPPGTPSEPEGDVPSDGS